MGNLPGVPPAVTGNFTATTTNLFQNTEYWYRIRACDSTSCSQFTTSPSKITPSLPGAPSAPNINSVAAVQRGRVQDVDLTWATSTQPSNYGGFSIFRSTDGGAPQFINSLPFNRKNPPPLFWRDLGLSLGSSYSHYVIQYESAIGCTVIPSNVSGPTTSPNNQAVFSVPSNTVYVLRGPTNLDGSFNDVTINLTWTDNSGNEDNFGVWKSTDPAFPSVNRTELSLPANTENLSDSAWTDNTTYYYKVRACKSGSSCSVFSNTHAVSTGLANPVLSASVLSASDTSGIGKVYLSWPGVPGATSYKAERATSTDFSNAVVLANQSADFYYDQNISLGEVYYYRVEASDAGGQTARSNIEDVHLNYLYILQGVAFANAGEGGIGWIKFSSADENGVASAIDYNVLIAKDGVVSGMAWASIENGRGYGWLSFSKSDSVGCPATPSNPNCEARFSTSTNELSGWARFYYPQVRAGESSWGAVDAPGWVSLKGVPQFAALAPFSKIASLIEVTPFAPLASIINFASAAGTPYGVRYNPSTGKFSGQAWGGNVTGWIGFSDAECDADNNIAAPVCTVRVTSFNQSPTVSNVIIEGPPESWCAADPFYRVRWDYSDPESVSQQAFDIQFIELGGGTAAFSESVTGLDGGQQLYRLNDPLTELAALTTYKTRVRASDGNSSSTWSESAATTTPTYYYPLVDFGWTPMPTTTGTVTTFMSSSTDRGGGISSYDWQFQFGSPSQSANPAPQTVFSRLPADASLTVTDSGNNSCIGTRTVSGTGSGSLKRRIFRER